MILYLFFHEITNVIFVRNTMPCREPGKQQVHNKYSLSYAELSDKILIKSENRELSGGLVVGIPGFHCYGPSSIPRWGTEIPQVTQQGQKKKKV